MIKSASLFTAISSLAMLPLATFASESYVLIAEVSTSKVDPIVKTAIPRF